jgi:hypothetical protein
LIDSHFLIHLFILALLIPKHNNFLWLSHFCMSHL